VDSWLDLLAELIAQKFLEETGAKEAERRAG
jgi:hypothetical protein